MAYSREFRRKQMEEDFKFMELFDNPLYNKKVTPEFIADYKAKLLKKDEEKAPGRSWAFVGINPPCGTFNIKGLYDYCVEHYPYKDYMMTVEQNTAGGIRPHLHILHPVSDNTRKNHVITRLAKVFKLESQSIDVSISRSSVVVSRWQNYIRGEKKEEKLENVEKDIKDREYYNIPNIYNASVAWSNTA